MHSAAKANNSVTDVRLCGFASVAGEDCRVVEHSIAFRVVSNILAGGRPLPPEILPASDLPSPVNGILWEMSELMTQERVAVRSSNLVEALNM